MEWFKLDDRTFTANFINVQYTLESTHIYPNNGQIGRQTCDLTIEIPYNKLHCDFLIKKYNNLNYKSTITSSKMVSQGCLLRNMTRDYKTITLNFMCDFIESYKDDLSERRDKILEVILDKTSK